MSQPQKNPYMAFLEEYWIWLLIAWFILLPGVGAGAGYFSQWASTDIILLVAVLAAAALVVMGMVIWWRIRLAQADAMVKQAMLQRGLSMEEIERLVSLGMTRDEPAAAKSVASAPMDDGLMVQELTSWLAQADVSEATLAQVLSAFWTADSSKRCLIYRAVRGLFEVASLNEERVLAVIRSLSQQDGTAGPAARPDAMGITVRPGGGLV
jgi:hypothetical protein